MSSNSVPTFYDVLSNPIVASLISAAVVAAAGWSWRQYHLSRRHRKQAYSELRQLVTEIERDNHVTPRGFYVPRHWSFNVVPLHGTQATDRRDRRAHAKEGSLLQTGNKRPMEQPASHDAVLRKRPRRLRGRGPRRVHQAREEPLSL